MDQGHRLLMQLHLTHGLGEVGAHKILSFLAQRAGYAHDFFSSSDFSERLACDIDFGFVYQLSTFDFIEQVGLLPPSARAAEQGLCNESIFDKECLLMERHGVKVVTLLDDSYPEALRAIHLPPLVVYIQGAPLQRVSKCLAVVGARAADEYAQAVSAAILPDIIAHGWNIVSGGALGADTYAHEISLQAGGKTIVVLGSGLLSWYPKQNVDLFERIIDAGGSIVSTFSLETPADKKTFPMRNRIVSGLSQGCVVVQAAQRSGALITAQYALEQGRHIFAVPGTLFSPLSEGCHDLIAQGAGIVTTARSILEVLDAVAPSSETQQSLAFIRPAQCGYVGVGYRLPKEQEQIDHPILMHMQKPMSIDELASCTSRSVHELHETLFTLQLEGFVKQNFAGLWERL